MKSIDKAKLKEIVPVLKLLKSSKPVTRKLLLKYLNSDVRQCVYGCIINCLKNPTLAKRKRKKLAKSLTKYKKNLRLLSDTADDTDEKQKVLEQTGGALPAIIAGALPLLASLFMKS